MRCRLSVVIALLVQLQATSATSPCNNRIDCSPSEYQHSAGLGLQLIRDAQGRITRATDPAGKSLTYAYNASGELASVTDRSAKVTRFDYASTARQTARAPRTTATC